MRAKASARFSKNARRNGDASPGGNNLLPLKAELPRHSIRGQRAYAMIQSVAHTRYAWPDKKGIAHTRRQEGSPIGEPFCDSVAEKPRRWAKTPAS
jgi:hypothetical protein